MYGKTHVVGAMESEGVGAALLEYFGRKRDLTSDPPLLEATEVR